MSDVNYGESMSRIKEIARRPEKYLKRGRSDQHAI